MGIDHRLVAFLGTLFEPLGDVVFCVKDREGRYVAVNDAFLARVGRSLADVVGRTAHDLFPTRLAESFAAQDRRVFARGRPLSHQLERVTNTDGSIGWYLAHKTPLRAADDRIIGLIGLSQDLHEPSAGALELARLAETVDHIRAHLDDPLRVEDLASRAGLTAPQLERRMKRVFRLSVKQFVIKSRLEEAARRLSETDAPVGEIALACGFADQSAFTRQFKATTGQTPTEYRRTSSADGSTPGHRTIEPPEKGNK